MIQASRIVGEAPDWPAPLDTPAFGKASGRIAAVASAADASEASAVFATAGWFAAGDITRVVGEGVNVTRVLARLVKEQRLVPNGKARRAARYMVAPPLIAERVDWTG